MPCVALLLACFASAIGESLAHFSHRFSRDAVLQQPRGSLPSQALSALLFSLSPMRARVGRERMLGRRTETSMQADFLENIQTRLRIAQESQKAGDNFKQIGAYVMAGEYDREAVRSEITELLSSNPSVMFTWETCPSCKKAVAAFDLAGAKVKNVLLEGDKGMAFRAELGQMVGRTPVPFVFINGTYVGGYDGGVSEEAPGIMDLAFKGTLIPKLQAAGAL